MIRALAAAALVASVAAPARAELSVCSKKFTESVILGEIVTQLARASGFPARHRAQLGGTQVVFRALQTGGCHVYVEYTGTLSREIFARENVEGEGALGRALEARGLRMSRPLGFNNTYALGMREPRAATLGIRTISDLAAQPSLRLGFSAEFLERADGWPSLRARYGLPQRDVRGLDHDLAYRGLASGAIDVTDLYSTDAEIAHYGLRVLADDRSHFRDYEAVLLGRADLPPALWAVLTRLEGRIDAARMSALNAEVKLRGRAEAEVAAGFLGGLGVDGGGRARSPLRALGRRTAEHLLLVGISLFAAILIAIPLGIFAARRPRLGQLVLAAAGLLQTIPSLALLVVMIPLFGIGAPPALAALFLYSLLPIVRSTHTGLSDIAPSVRESAEALGLGPGARLRLVELPMASRAILSGIKTSAVINVGTATLGAIIGAGGYGEPILTGIRLDDLGLILQGAIPAAVLALLVQGLFEALERWLVPKGLRLRPDR